MALENQVVQEMFKELELSNQQAPTFKLEATLIVNGENINLARIDSIQDNRDYRNQRYSLMALTVGIPFTTYVDKVYPFKDELLVEIKYEIATSSGARTVSQDHYIRRYKAFLTSPTDPSISSPNRDVVKASDKAMTPFSTVTLQLQDELTYEMAYAPCGGIYPNTRVDDLMKVMLSYGLTPDEQRAWLTNKDFDGVRGVSITPVDNQRDRLIVIKGNTNIMDLPFVLQDGDYGVYNTDIGVFYQKHYTMDNYYQSVKGGLWFVYPIYNFENFDSAPRKLTIYMAPEQEFPGLEKTFTYYDQQLFVFAVGESKNFDYSEYSFFEKGNGVVYGRSSEILDKSHRVDGNRLLPDADQTKRSFISKERKDGYNDVRYVDNHFTENPYKYASDLAKNNVRVISLLWNRSMPDLLIPGMPTKLLYLDGEEIKELKAVLVNVDTTTKGDQSSMGDQSYVNNSVLTFIVEPK